MLVWGAPQPAGTNRVHRYRHSVANREHSKSFKIICSVIIWILPQNPDCTRRIPKDNLHLHSHSSELFATLESGLAGIWILKSESRFRKVDRAVWRLCGRMADSEEELRGDSKSRFFAPVEQRDSSHIWNLKSVPLKNLL